MNKIKELVPLICDTLNQNKEFRLRVTGTSMKPFLFPTDYVYLKKVDSLEKGNIILYQRKDGTYILHRIVKLKPDYLVLSGDHQLFKEYPIYKNQVIAKVSKIEKNGQINDVNKFSYKIYFHIFKFKFIRKLYLCLEN